MHRSILLVALALMNASLAWGQPREADDQIDPIERRVAEPAPPPSSPLLWSRILPPAGVSTGFYDPKRDRYLLLPQGYRSAPGEYWELRLTGEGERWTRRFWRNPGPSWLLSRAAVYDARQDRLVVLARDARLPAFGQAPMAVWAVSLEGAGEWRELSEPFTPPIDRREFSLVFDTKRSQFVLFGGVNEVTRQYQTDTWRLDPQVDAAVWSPVITEGDSVGGHAYSGSIYDAGRDRMVIFGGVRQIETGGAFIDPSNDILTLEFGEGNRWTVARTDLPFDVRASYPSCLYDVAHDRMVVFSRYHGLSALSLEDLSTWIDIDEQRPNFSPVAVVSSGSLAVSIGSDRIVRKFSISQFSGYEALGPERDGLGVKKGVHPGGPTFPQGKDGSLLYWGGFFAIEGEAERDLWRFSPDVEPHWSHSLLAGGLPHPRSDAAFAYDGRRHRWWMYGGYSRDTVGTYLADVWSFDPIKLHWERFDLPAGPGSRYGAGLAYDGFRDRLVLFGGADAGAQYARDTWALPLSGDMRWIALSTSVRVPQGRAFSALVCEPDRDRLVLAGGVRWTSSPIFFARRFRDTWTFDLETGTWDSLATQPAVPLNEHEQFAWYDVARGLVNTFGGEGLNGSTFRTGSLRALDDEALGWKYAPDSDGAPGSTLAPALDPERDRFYVFNEADLGEGWVLQRNHPTHRVFLESAGRNGQGPETIVLLGDPLFDVSALDVGSVTLAGARARGNSDGGPTRDFNGDGYIDRILRFDRSDLRLDPASKTARFEGRSRDGVALVGFLPRTVFSSTTTASGDPDSPHDTVRPLSLFALGFERGEGTLRLDLPSRERVRLEIYGVNGRRVEGRDLGMLEAGQHDLPEFGLAGKTAGIYFVRATVGTQATQTRLVWIP